MPHSPSPDLHAVVREIAEEMRARPDRGEVATYIPELARVDANAFGLVVIDADGHEVTCAQEAYGEVSKALEARFGEPRRTALIWKAQNTIEVDDETGEKLLRLVEVIEDQDDVQNVFVNFALSEALMEKLAG